MNIINALEKEQLKDNIPNVEVGDYLKVHLKVKEGVRERIQIFEGTLISMNGGGLNKMMTVRRLSYGVGVERKLLINSPKISKIEIVRKGIVRRAKLYFLRDRVGKAAKIRERITTKSK